METNVQGSNFIEVAISSEVNYVPFNADLAASEIVILNNTGVTIDVRQDNGGVAGSSVCPCKDGTFLIVDGIVNANQVMVKLHSAGGAVTLNGRLYN